MMCQFCKQDVENPCHDMQELQQRASQHVERCEHALKGMQQAAPSASQSEDSPDRA